MAGQGQAVVIQHRQSVSCSHWGMFELVEPPFIVPSGFRLDERDMAELHKPGGIVRLIPVAKNKNHS